MATWFDSFWGKVKDAKTPDEARAVAKDYGIDPATGERTETGGDDADSHIHIHLEGKEGDMRGRDELDPGADPGQIDEPDAVPDNAEMFSMLQDLSQRVEELEGGDEGEMELESKSDDGTKDVRRFTYRRGAKLSATRDEDELIPERNPEMIGETDLPGIEDLDKRMPNATASDRKRALDHALKDSAMLEDNWHQMAAVAEIIQPGVRIPTFDARLDGRRSLERMCAFRRRVVDHALKHDEFGPTLQSMVGIRSVDGCSCDTVKVAFNAIGSAIGQHQNSSIVTAGLSTEQQQKTRDAAAGTTYKGPPSNADWNKTAKEFWASQRPGASRH